MVILMALMRILVLGLVLRLLRAGGAAMLQLDLRIRPILLGMSLRTAFLLIKAEAFLATSSWVGFGAVSSLAACSCSFIWVSNVPIPPGRFSAEAAQGGTGTASVNLRHEAGAVCAPANMA